MRLMSFSLTTKQYSNGTKDVTRRLGWEYLKEGEAFMGCLKVMGRRKGEPLVKLGASMVVKITREPLRRMIDDPAYGRRECAREGFDGMPPAQFVTFFCHTHKGCTPDTTITRIEFRRVKA